MAATAKVGAHRRPANRWSGLAAVARERASEKAAEAARTSDTDAAAPHLEQRAYLLKLAEVYDRRAVED